MLKYSAAGLTALWPCWFAWWWWYQSHVYPRGFLNPSWLWPVLPVYCLWSGWGTLGPGSGSGQSTNYGLSPPFPMWTELGFISLVEISVMKQHLLCSLQLKLDWKRTIFETTIGIFVCSKRKTEFLSNWFWTQLFTRSHTPIRRQLVY